MSPIERGRDEGIRGAEDQISADHEEEGDSSPVQRVLLETQIPGRDASNRPGLERMGDMACRTMTKRMAIQRRQSR